MFPLSFAQRRLWFLDGLEGPSATYNVPNAFRLSGPLRVDALRCAFVDVIGRHESLRTVFQEMEGEPRQVVLPVDAVSGGLRVEEVGRDGLDEFLAREAAVPFLLSSDLPIRGVLVRLGELEHVLLVVVHHIAADGWSLGPLMRDLAFAYGARCRGEEPSWAPLPVQYVDYTLWQRELLGSPEDPDSVLRRQLDYWREQLGGLPAVLDLPTDRPRPAIASHQGGQVPFRCSPELYAGLRALARESQATLFMVLQAGLAALLTRMGAGEDVPIGSPIAGRGDAALDDLVGFFVNTLVLRTDTSGDPTFRELLARVRATDLAAYANQDVPFERVVEALNPTRSRSWQPLFQVSLNFRQSNELNWEPAGLDISHVPVPVDVEQFDLSLYVTEGASGINGGLNYSADLFDQAAAEAVVARLVRLLESVVADPGQRLRQIDLLPPEEHRNLVAVWNDTHHEVADLTVPGLFEAQASRTPDAVALICGSAELTYSQLNEHANRLAHCLTDRQIGRNDIVAISLPRSIDMIVTILGVMKTGAAYLPVDPKYPAERRDLMLGDARPAVWVTAAGSAGITVDSPGGTLRLELGSPSLVTELRTASRENVTTPAGIDGQEPAYVIYTSGSTGRPKGVVVPHAALSNLLASMQSNVALREQDILLSVTTPSFDIAALEIFLPLVNGARLVLAAADETRDAALLADLVGKSGATVLQATPSLWQELVSSHPDVLSGLTVLVGGEALPDGLAEVFREKSRRAVNQYGPTETTIWSSTSDIGTASRSSSIGRPIWNTRFYVLDDRLQLAPTGVPGELYIAGSGLAHGYLNRSALTAERFVADPFCGPGARMYRTGDLVRRNFDGVLEFIGRLDGQVKIRGFRIETGEIEAVLSGHAGLTSVVVEVREEQPGDKRIVAYCVPRRSQAIKIPELRDFAATLLPEYMVPSAFVVLDEFPLTPNGKIDRKKLPAPVYDAAPVARGPKNAQEEILSGLFADALRVESIGVNDDFFEAGGHSLLAMRLISRIRSALNVWVSMRTLFDTPTVAGLAAAVEAGGEKRRTPLERRTRPDVVPLSFAQRRLWFLDGLEGPSATYNVPNAFRLSGPLRVDALRCAFVDVIGRHESLRTVFQEMEGEPRQVVLPVDAVSGGLRVEEVGRDGLDEFLAREAAVPFLLSSDLPIRGVLVRLGELEHVLLVVVHHIAADGWSLGPLMRDLAFAYGARCRGEEPSWAPLPVQYVDYTLWQRELLGSPEDPDSVLRRQLDYWREQLGGLPAVLDLPTDRPRPAIASHQGGQVPFRCSPELYAGLRALARESQATLFMVLQAGLAALLTRMGAGEDVPIGSPIAGRGDAALDDLVGFFVNTLVLRTDTSGDPTFRELLARVRATDLAAYANQDVPFERVVEALNPTRSRSWQPLFQVLLTFQNSAEGMVWSLGGAESTHKPVSEMVAKFDLAFIMREVSGSTDQCEEIVGRLEYAQDLFDQETAEALSARLVRVLESVVGNPDALIGDIDIVLEPERDLVLQGWNSIDAALPGITV